MVGTRYLPLTLAAVLAAASGCKSPNANARLRDADPTADANPTAVPDSPGAATGAYPGPPGGLSESENFALWSNYCKGQQNDPTPAGPNYDNDEVKRAAVILSQMNAHSFALYGQINIHYKKAPAAKPEGTTQTAHEWLVYLCGEFRDRAPMVKAKINWVLRTNYLSTAPQPQVDPAQDPWQQMTAETYGPYLAMSRAYYDAKFEALQAKGKITFGALANVDRPVSPLSVCETKFMFAEYLDEKKTFDGLEAFLGKYETFKTASCQADDLDYYYDFRGDGNFKPNSPESNGMIWHAISTALQCKDTGSALAAPNPKYPGQQVLLKDQDCKNYFLHPFASRWNGARAGLGAWVLHDRSLDSTFQNSKANVTIQPNWGKDPAFEPAKFTTEAGAGNLVASWQAGYPRPELGLYTLAGGNDASPATQQFIYEQLRNSVDRHTDWYASGYDDLMKQKRERDQAYSPFVASSYEMSASDAFTAPCYTIPCDGDVPARHWKQFMFVFKVHKSKYFSTENLEKNEKIDFDQNWFDETTFGTTGLAKGEHAWDRMGTALESEFDSILYLHHICSGGQLEKDGVTCN